MIYLTQLTLNPRSRQVRSELAAPYEMHRTLMRGFANDVKRENANLLHRLEISPYSGALTLLVQSTVEPNWQPLTQAGQGQYLLSPPVWKAVDLQLANNRLLQFRLTANPTVKKVRRDENGKRINSNRVPLLREEKQLAWLQRKGQLYGFHLLHTQISQIRKQDNRKRNLTLFTVQFNGQLQITNAETFLQALKTGIGPAKAFGCGLLSLAPAC